MQCQQGQWVAHASTLLLRCAVISSVLHASAHYTAVYCLCNVIFVRKLIHDFIAADSAFAFPVAGTHLQTPEGWKAELASVAGYVMRQFTCPKAVTHPTTNRAQRRKTALIEPNVLPMH